LNYKDATTDGSDTASFVFMYEPRVANFTITNFNDTSISENTDYVSGLPTIGGDTPVGNLNYTISGDDVAYFSIDEQTGQYTFMMQDFENPIDANDSNNYEICITATDEIGNYINHDLTITVTDSIELVDFDIVAVVDTSISENTIYDAPWPSLTGDTPIGELYYELGGPDAALFEIDSLNGRIKLLERNYEIPSDQDLDNIYEVALIGIDEDGNSDTSSWSIAITNIIENRNFNFETIADISLNENEALRVVTSISGDTPIGIVTYSISGGVDSTLFEINATTGEISFDSKDFENPLDENQDNIYELRIRVTDSDGNLDEEEFTVSIINQLENASFEISLITDTTFVENEDFIGATPLLLGDNPIGDIVYTLSGDDANEFSIDSITGIVTSISKDFENPSDANLDNVYDLILTVTDGDGNTADTSFSISLINVNDGDYDVLEASINNSLSSIDVLFADDLYQGDTLSLMFAFQYVYGDGETESLLANLLLVNENGETIDSTVNLGSFGINDTTYFYFDIPTFNFSGNNVLTVKFNTDTSFFEDSYNNNVYYTNFKVDGDFVPPLLDVTFDGSTIADGDLVGPNPRIVATIFDDNNFFYKTDLEGVTIQIKPDTCYHEDGIIDCYDNVDSNHVTFIPATSNSDFQVIYQPDTLLDGTYTLRVFGEDAAGNEASPYEISFEVKNITPGVSAIKAFPNPCEDVCNFAFIVVGKENIEDFRIQVMDAMGKLIEDIYINAESLNNGWNEVEIDVSSYNQGMYMYRIFSKDTQTYSGESFNNVAVPSVIGRFFVK